MNNITHKVKSHRVAIAKAVVTVSQPGTIEAVKNKKVPKGDVFEFSRAAGLLAIKHTSHVIPDCHPIPVEFASIQYEIEELNIIITVEVQTIYRTGVEVEAMHGAAITALTIYDMLKPIDKNISINSIHLDHKKGGKSDFNDLKGNQLKCAVIVCSDSVAAKKKEDKAGKAIVGILEQQGLTVSVYEVIPDDHDRIRESAARLSNEKFELIIFTGGTGLSPRDVTPEAITPLLDRLIPGIMEAARAYGQERTPYAMLSRGIAGYIKNSLVLTLPGSTRGAEETMNALFPYILHVFKVAEGMRHS